MVSVPKKGKKLEALFSDDDDDEDNTGLEIEGDENVDAPDVHTPSGYLDSDEDVS